MRTNEQTDGWTDRHICTNSGCQIHRVLVQVLILVLVQVPIQVLVQVLILVPILVLWVPSSSRGSVANRARSRLD